MAVFGIGLEFMGLGLGMFSVSVSQGHAHIYDTSSWLFKSCVKTLPFLRDLTHCLRLGRPEQVPDTLLRNPFRTSNPCLGGAPRASIQPTDMRVSLGHNSNP